MEKQEIINKLKDEKSKLMMQLAESPNPLMTEIVLQGVHRIQALTWVIKMLEGIDK